MYLDSNLKLEIISSLLGQNVKPYEKKTRETTTHILSVDEFHLHNLTGKGQVYVKGSFIKEEDFFDPDFDCDFNEVSDSAECTRGDELYERPKGWYRMALKVRGKYPDGDTWLGTNEWRSHSVPGEWPVSYHGTSLKGVKGIIRSHYSAGDRAMYGRGIYSTPDIHVAEREEYAKTFTSKTTGKSYKVILQNRINPEKREICQRFDYWLVRVHKGTPAEEEKMIVESSLRPYGILIKELNDEGSEDDEGDEDSDDEDTDDGNASDDCSDGDDGSVNDSCDDDDDDDGDGIDDDDENDCDVNGKYDDDSVDDNCNDDDGIDDDDEDDEDDGDVSGKYDDDSVDDNCNDDDGIDDDAEDDEDDGDVNGKYDDDTVDDCDDGGSGDDDNQSDSDGSVDDSDSDSSDDDDDDGKHHDDENIDDSCTDNYEEDDGDNTSDNDGTIDDTYSDGDDDNDDDDGNDSGTEDDDDDSS